jgi:hypothetical protein
MAFIWLISDASIPPYVARNLQKGGVAHAMLTADLCHRHTAFGLPQDRDDLFIGAYAAPSGATVPSWSAYLLVCIQNPLVHLAEKTLPMQPTNFGGEYPLTLAQIQPSTAFLAAQLCYPSSAAKGERFDHGGNENECRIG